MAALMTRRHFVHIARTLSNLKGVIPEDQRKKVAESFANDLKGTNGRFDKGRFLRACSIHE